MSLFGRVFGALKTIGHDAEVGVHVASTATNNPFVAAAFGFFPPASGALTILKLVNRYTGVANDAVNYIEAAHEAAGKVKSGAEKQAFAIDQTFGGILEFKKLEAEARGHGFRYNVDLPAQIIDHTSAAATLTRELFDSFEEFDPATGIAIPAPVAQAA